jgi:hypothetical protein
LSFRDKILKNRYDISTLIVVEEIPIKRVELALKSHVYEDIREELIEV